MSPLKTIHESVLDCIGKTPLVRLNKIPIEEGIQCEIGKFFKVRKFQV